MERITTSREEILRAQQSRWIDSEVNLGNEEGSAGTGRVLLVEEGKTSGYGVTFEGNALFRFEAVSLDVTDLDDVKVNVSFPSVGPRGELVFGLITCLGWINKEVFDL
jgi:hypothetical protein